MPREDHVLSIPTTIALGLAVMLAVLMLTYRHRYAAWKSRRFGSDVTIEYTRIVLPGVGFIVMGCVILRSPGTGCEGQPPISTGAWRAFGLRISKTSGMQTSAMSIITHVASA